MAIYRGPGGAGDATADATNAASVAEGFADASAASAAAASGSAATASAAATAAGAAQTAAEAAQAAAETAETNAETAETNAETAQTAAEAAQTAAEAAQTAAELAETNAETAETGALAAQSAAEAAQTAAELAETNAETAETNAVAAQTAAEAARDSALAAYDNFDDRYLGAKTSDPTLDNDGDALVAGALYFNSVDNAMRVYTGSVWVDAYAAGTTFLAKANNLSDLTNVVTARQNLDLEIGVDVQAFDATILKSADIGVTVQGYDADTAKYDDTTANFTGTLQNGGSNVVVDTDIGVTVQGYDADTAKLDVAQSFTAKQTFGTTTKIEEVLEKITVSATAATGTINFDALTQGALYYTTNASGNWTLNIRGDSGTSLDTMMATGESLTVVFLVTQGSTAYYNSAFQIDGSSVTPKWLGGDAPTEGTASSIDAYTYVIVKTGSATFTVFASVSAFA